VFQTTAWTVFCFFVGLVGKYLFSQAHELLLHLHESLSETQCSKYAVSLYA
jgi:hypothetical protein